MTVGGFILGVVMDIDIGIELDTGSINGKPNRYKNKVRNMDIGIELDTRPIDE